MKRFYSSLRLVPDSMYERAVEELDAYTSNTSTAYKTSLEATSAIGDVETIAYCGDTVRLTHRSHTVYGYLADIHYKFGVDLPLLLTKAEAFKILSAARLRRCSDSSPVSSFFGKLPRELRDRIYDFALPRQRWALDEDVSIVTELDLLGSIEPGILTVNHQMREEALPLAYRKTRFQVGDIDDLIKLLLAIGRVGRENIESLEFCWQSKAEFDFTRDEAPGIVRREDIDLSKTTLDGMELEDPFFSLPVVHVETCLQLLKQCGRLADIRLILEKKLIEVMNPEAFKIQGGIRGLSSIRGLKRVEIWSYDQEPLEQEGVARWLKEQMESTVL
ncbi:MAG: hypothetical protein Q9213_000492 [Squamulea squamosa]